jgi:hypothetical protein
MSVQHAPGLVVWLLWRHTSISIRVGICLPLLICMAGLRVLGILVGSWSLITRLLLKGFLAGFLLCNG